MASRLERRLSEQKQRQKKRFLLIIVLLLLFVSVVGASYWWFSGGAHRSGLLPASEGKMNVLVLGVDERAGDVGRSDTMMVFTIDTQTKDVSLLSVPRDTRMRIPGHGWDKINHAYAEGGSKLSQQSVEELLGIPIDYYVTVNFAGFYKIVDAIGGVTIDVEKRMHYEDPYDNLVIDLKPGVQRMDGKTAIQYVRYRDEDGDIGRVARQQKFIKAMFSEVVTPSVITRIPAIIREVNAAIKTDMPTSEMLNLAKSINDAYKQGLKTYMVPGKPAFIGEVSYWLPDIGALREYIAQTENLPMNDRYQAETRHIAGEYATSIPKEMKVVELPKSLQPVKPPMAPDKPKPVAKPEVTAPSSVPVPAGKVRVEVLNASGSPEAGEKAASMLRGQGFEVTSVSSSSAQQKNTVVVSHTMNNAVIGKLTGLPFNYVLQVTKDDNRTVPVTVVLGSDFAGK